MSAYLPQMDLWQDRLSFADVVAMLAADQSKRWSSHGESGTTPIWRFAISTCWP